MFYSKEVLSNNGKGSTNIIWKYLTIKGYDQNLIKKRFLFCLNEITKPDIEFEDIFIKEEMKDTNRQSAPGEIYFEIKEGLSVPLSKMGSGVKTIIQVLLNMIVIPVMEKKKTEEYVFGFEELENNLHPSMQRRLFKFIAHFAKNENSIFFITTHSSIVIDLFTSDKNAQIVHVENRGINSITKSVSCHSDNRGILKDLDYKASDVLLSNGVIWVEGPSDSIYLELLLDLYKKKVDRSNNINHCVQSLSTAIWKYAGFTDFNWADVDAEIENRIISLAKINHNHLVVLDRDNNYEYLRPSEWDSFKNGNGKNKARLISESMKFANQDESLLNTNYGDTNDGKLFFWINDGTFETYLEYFISNKGAEFNKYFEQNEKLGYFEKKRKGEDCSKSKIELAAEIAKFALKNGLTIDDFAPAGSSLLNKIERLLKTIEGWN